MTTREPLLRVRDLLTDPSEGVLPFLDANAGGCHVEFAGSGTAALYRGAVSHFGSNASGTVLLPSYVCDVAVLPFRAVGLDVAFYEVTRKTGIDVDDVASKVTDETVAVMSVDFFGFSARGFEPLDRLCRRRGLVHIEDNAHSLLSRADDQLLGTRTGFGITSIPKLLPVPDGGILYTSSLQEMPRSPFREAEFSDLDFLVRNTIKWADLHLFDGEAVRAINERWGESPSLDGIDAGEVASLDWIGVDQVSPLTEAVLRRIDTAEVIERRRRNYEALVDLLSDDPAVDPLYPDLSAGTCPQVFPVVAENPDAFERRLRSATLPVHRWPRLPPAVRGNEAFPTANYLAKHVFTLPVHQTCDPDDLVRKVQSVAARAV